MLNCNLMSSKTVLLTNEKSKGIKTQNIHHIITSYIMVLYGVNIINAGYFNRIYKSCNKNRVKIS